MKGRFKVYGEGVWVLPLNPSNIESWLESSERNGFERSAEILSNLPAQTRVFIPTAEDLPELVDSLTLAIKEIDKAAAKESKRGRKPGTELKYALKEIKNLLDNKEQLEIGSWNSHTLRAVSGMRVSKELPETVLPIDYAASEVQPKEEKKARSGKEFTPTEFLLDRIGPFLENFFDDLDTEGKGKLQVGDFIISRPKSKKGKSKEKQTLFES